jgi:diguanylate cyclase (GGDEF)-like protein/PAS domain S-box-containing protein
MVRQRGDAASRGQRGQSAAEADYRLLIEHIPTIAYVQKADDTGSMQYVSPPVETILGYTPEECIAEPGFFFRRIHPDDQAAVETEDVRTNATGEPFRMEYRMLTRDGRYVWVRDEALLVADETGRPRAWYGILFDITARKQAETSLRLALAAAKMGTWDWDLTTGMLSWSEESETLHGLAPGTFIGSYEAFLDGLHPEDRPRIESAVNAALASGEDYEAEYRVVGQDGAANWEYVKGKLIRDAAGGPVRMTGVAVDITARRQAEEELRRNEERFRSLVQNTADIIAIVEADATVRYVSPAIEHVLGYRADEIIGTRSIALHHPEDTTGARVSFAEALDRPGESISYQLRARHADGSWRRLEVTLTNHLADPGVGGLIVNARDVTERWRAERQLREAEARYRALVEQIAAVVYVDDVEGPSRERVTRYISPQIEAMLGYTAAEWVADRTLWAARLHPDDQHRTMAEVVRTTESGDPFRVEYRLLARNGRTVWVRDEAVPVRDTAGRPVSWHGIVHDVTERKALEAQLAYQAFHDALTGLPNRALFNDRLEHALQTAARHGEPVAVLFLDLDRFKVVNDSLGHEAGDRLLIEAGERFTSCLRAGDTIARLGGDEFAILVEGVSGDEAHLAADRILNELRLPFRLAGQEIYATASIGIALSAPERTTPGELLRAADVALYEAKRSGRATAVPYEPGMTVQAAAWISLDGELRRAIERCEFVLHYQPIVDLPTGTIRSLEALLRWEHPTRGLISPIEFLPLAEEIGLIEGIGIWVLAEACRQLRSWRRAYPTVTPQTINVNLAARQLRDPNLVDCVAHALAVADLDPSSLRLEIVEQALMEDLRATAGTLRALRELGVHLAIDDFGAGASSLASLRELPADVLKLDRSFIRPLGGSGDEDEAIVAAIAALGHRLGMRVTAEGIETKEQLAAVRRADCDSGQGYLFGRPIPAAAVPALLHRGTLLAPAPETAGLVIATGNGAVRAALRTAV